MSRRWVADARAAAELVLCSKSAWDPPVRREHALATVAAQHGHAVTFLASPGDVRQLGRGNARGWARGLRPTGRGDQASAQVRVKDRSTFVPGHRGVLAGALDNALLRRVLRAESQGSASVVCCLPWDWPAVANSPARRRVFDMADDWGELMPGRRERFERIYRRIAEEADEVIVVNPALAERFAGRRPHVVRNGVFDDMLIESQRAPEERTMVYVGTLTPRFDAPLMREVLTALPDWRLELVGACMYPGYSDGPAPELEQLLGLHQRVRWHGPMSRERSTEVLDRAAVAVVPNRRERSLGQDSMKFYDYAARGRPIVTTDWRDGIEQEGPPHVLVARTPDEFVRGVLAAARQRPEAASDGRRWAAQNTWNQRWVAWSRAVFGS